jgi:subtilisin-like proprotein convertase family protein
MKRMLTAASILLFALTFWVASIAIAQDDGEDVQAQQAADEDFSSAEGEAGTPVQAPGSPSGDGCFATVTITPNAALPDGDPTLTCFDMALGAPPSATIVDVEVVAGVTHTWVGDLIYQIVHPGGDHVTMMDRPGRTGSGAGDSSNLLSNAPLTFGDAFGDDAETMGNTIGGDQVICQDDGRCAYVPNRDEDLTSLVNFADLAGANASGTWQFCASDNAGADTGTVTTVTLNVTCQQPPGVAACTIGNWQSVADVNNGRSRTGLAYSAVTGKFYLLGGEGESGNRALPIEEYDPATDIWTDKSLLNVNISNSGAAAVGAYIYVPGGYDGATARDEMQRYDPAADAVTTVAPMPGANYAHAVTSLDGAVYVLGGSSTGAAGSTNYIYDVATDNWAAGAPLPTAVQYPAAATDGSYIYVIGGNTTNLATVQRYDPGENTWATIASLSTGRGGPGAFFDGANLWAIGGGWTSYLTSTEYWNGAGWQAGPAMNAGVRTMGAAYGGGIALKAAGWSGTYQTAAEVLEIDCHWPLNLPVVIRGGTAAGGEAAAP